MQGSLESNPFYNYVRSRHFAKLLDCNVMLVPNESSFMTTQAFSLKDVGAWGALVRSVQPPAAHLAPHNSQSTTSW